jgi:lambda family phage minor tail protein L
MTIKDELRVLHQPSPFVELFTLDCSNLGGSVYYFTPNVLSTGGNVVFNSITYQPIPIITSGWEMKGTGEQARPSISVSNVNQVLLNAVATLKDIRYAKVTRIRTLEKFLDGQPTADPTQYIDPMDFYYVYQKTAHNRNLITWTLTTPLEAFNQKLPGRQFLKDGPDGFPGLSRIRSAL